MRKLLSLAVILLAPSAVCAISGPQTLVSETALTYSTSPIQNLNAYGSPQGSAAKLSAQITVGSATVAAQTFTGGTQSTATIVVLSNNILAAAASNTITTPSTSAILGAGATAQITVVSTSGLTGACLYIGANSPLIFCNGAVGSWTGVSTASGTASSIAAAINGVSGIVANWPGGTSAVVFTSASVVGLFGNSYTLVSSTQTALSASAALFSGGKDPVLRNGYFTLNGSIYRNGVEWTDLSGTSTGTAASIGAFINSISTAQAVAGGGLGSIRASVAGGVVTLTHQITGAAGNAVTLTVTPSTGGLVAGGATFTGGQSAATLTINGVTLTAGVNFSTSATLSTIATNIAAAINAQSATIGVAAAGVSTGVFSTSTVVGTSANYLLASSTQAALRLSPPFVTTAGASTGVMTGGTNSGYNITTDQISITNHGFTKALPVLYSTSAANAIGGLAWGTTYFVVVVDANTIGLSSTSAVALTGNYINLTSSVTSTTATTYTLTPGPFIQGAFSGKWQVSNDGGNWADFTVTSQGIVVSSQTVAIFSPVFPSSTVVQDFGFVDYGYIRYNIVGPTQGGASLRVILNAKD